MKTKFTFSDNGVEKKLAIVHPTEDVLTEANAVQNKVFREALNKGALLGVALDKTMRDQGLWDDSKQKQFEELSKRINENRFKLKKGGIKKSEGKELALQVITDANAQRNLLSDRSVYNARTADGQSDNARFNYLVSACVVDDETGEKLYKNVTDYEQKSSTELAVAVATKLAEVMFGFGNESSSVEYKFLKKFGYVDEKLRLINENGHLVDRAGRLINEDGRYVNDKEELVDINGNRVDEEGEPIVDECPFLDDDGKPIIFEEEKVEAVEDKVEEKVEESELVAV